MYFSVVCAALDTRVSLLARIDLAQAMSDSPGSALFSFEGTTRKSHVLLNLENCIEKNFHVSNMKSGLTRSVRVRCKFERRQYVEFKVKKGRMVDT